MAKYVTIDLDKIVINNGYHKEEGAVGYSYLYYPIASALRSSMLNDKEFNRIATKLVSDVANSFINYNTISDALGTAIVESINDKIIITEDGIDELLRECTETKNKIDSIKNAIELISKILAEVRVDGGGENIKTLFDAIALIKKLCGGKNASNA